MPEMNYEETLAHFGVKGMKWGVRNEDKPSDGHPRFAKGKTSKKLSSAELIQAAKNPPKLTEKQKQANLKDAEEKSAAKHGLTTAKKVQYGLTAALVVGVVGYAVYKDVQYNKAVAGVVPGGKIDAALFAKITDKSKTDVWMNQNYFSDQAFARPEITLPVGHTLHRISTAAETAYKPTTYATASIDDFNRYVAGFRSEKGVAATFHKITMQSTEEIRIPNLKTRIETFSEAYKALNPDADASEVMTSYKFSVGGAFSLDHEKEYLSRLISKGYSAIIDDMDVDVIGDAPMILIDPAKFSKKVAETLSDVDISKAEESLVELTQRLGVNPNYASKAVKHMSEMDYEETLAHFGVKGMKWGVRKDRGDRSFFRRKPKAGEESDDAKNAAAAKAKVKAGGPQALSNQELKQLVERMNLERQYSSLSAQNTSGGKQYAVNMLKNIGNQQLQQIAGRLIAKQVERAFK